MCKAVVFYVLNRTVSCSLLVCGDIGNRSKQPAWTHIHTLCHLPTVHLGQKLCTISNSSPANPNPPRSAPAQREMTPLHLVANLGLAEVVNVLLEAGADKEARNVSRRNGARRRGAPVLEMFADEGQGCAGARRQMSAKLYCTCTRARARTHTHTHTHTQQHQDAGPRHGLPLHKTPCALVCACLPACACGWMQAT